MASAFRERGSHLVQFYEDTTFLAERVAELMRESLVAGGAAIVLARPHTLAALEDQLRSAGIAITALTASGQLQLIDARALLSTLMAGALPDRARFREHIGGLIAARRATGPDIPLQVYDEMVDLLWVEDHPEAVVALEGLWSELLAVESFALLSGYRLTGVADGRPGRSFALPPLDVTTARAIAQIEGRARALVEAERSARRAAEAAAVLAEESTRAREEILSVVSHDLRNPLGTIMMGASTLLSIEAAERSPRTRAIAERIHRQAERMARLIEDLVDFAGIQAGRLAIQRRPHAPRELLLAATDLFGPLAQERGLTLETGASSELPAVQCDSERAIQVFSNLLSNAIKVTPQGGSITIGAEPDGEDVVFFVRDTGPGIDPDELPNLFQRYWRSKKLSYKGAGLGLSIARGIIDAHGGRIWAESQVGVGSTFFFSFSSARNA